MNNNWNKIRVSICQQRRNSDDMMTTVARCSKLLSKSNDEITSARNSITELKKGNQKILQLMKQQLKLNEKQNIEKTARGKII